jgi:hypothetical protein
LSRDPPSYDPDDLADAKAKLRRVARSTIGKELAALYEVPQDLSPSYGRYWRNWIKTARTDARAVIHSRAPADQRQGVGDRERMVNLRHRPAVALPSLILQGGKEAKAGVIQSADCASSVAEE